MSHHLEPRAHQRGVLWMLVCGLMFVAMAVMVRYLGSDLPVVEAAFIRYLFGIPLLWFVIIRIEWRKIARTCYGLYMLRGIAHSVAVMLWFFAMARIPIAEVTAIGYATPIFIAIGAWLLFGEHLRYRRVGALVVAFFGMLIILRPGFQTLSTGTLAQLLATPCFAISYLFTKQLTKTQPTGNIIVMLTIFCALALFPATLLQWRTPQVIELVWLFLIAVVATLGHYAMTRAFAYAPMTVTQPFAFAQLIWATLFGLLLFNETPDFWILGGGALIITALTYLAHRETLANKNQKTHAKTQANVV